MRFDFEATRAQLSSTAGCPVDVQQVSPLRQRTMLDWPAPSLHEYEERAAVFEYLGNKKRIEANNDAFDVVLNAMRERVRPSLYRVHADLQERLLKFFARVPFSRITSAVV